MSAPQAVEPAPTHRTLLHVLAVVGLAVVLSALAFLRRSPELIDDLYGVGNILNTHEASGLSLLGFGQDLGRVEVLSLMALVVACATYAARRQLVGSIAVVITFAAVYADSVARYATTIAGHLYVAMCDDAFISMRYARNFAAGRGLVYNQGEAVDGFTNPLWTMIMVVPHALGLHEGVATIPILILGGVLLVSAGLLARTVLASEGAPIAIQLFAALAVMLDAAAFEFTVAGLEAPLMSIGASLVLYGGLRGRERLLGVGLCTLTLARADGAIVAGLLVGWLILEEAATSGKSLVAVARTRWKRVALVAIVAAVLVAWRIKVYGHPAPNTFYLKVYPIADRIHTGLAAYGVRGLVTYGLPAAFVLFVAAADERARRARRMLLPVLGIWLYSIYVGGDAFGHLRFLGPATPLLWTAVGLAAAAGWSRRASSVNAAIFAALALLVPVHSERGVLGSTWSRADWIRSNVIATKTLERNVPPEASIATFYAGLAYYAPNRRFVDLLGKTESHIAHQRRIHGAIPGHNKFDFEYAYRERKPEVTFTALTCDEVERFLSLAPEERLRRRPTFKFVYQAPVEQLLDPAFVELYASQRVAIVDGDAPAGHPIGCWFVREGANVPLVWQLARE